MRRPVYHRDVTPQNILLGKDGAVKLTDFGLARAMDRASITEPNVIKGKVGYLAPEMTEAVHPTPQTDMYALGVVMWQALTGQRLFDGKDEVEIFLAAKRGEVPPVLEIRPDVPQALGAVIDRSLAYDPRDRFESAQQMQRVLGGVLRGLGAIVEREELARSVRMICSFRHEGELPREV
jgi:serine/threonine-protein kinase